MNKDDNIWMPISDLMSGLMLIFLFISVAYMLKINNNNQKIKDTAGEFALIKKDLYLDLYQEFRDDLKFWNAEIDSVNLVFRFKEPDIYFEVGKETLQEQFIKILDDFFPRYLKILMEKKYTNEIEEVRIEGHTSSEWQSADKENAFLLNMELSQKRALAVLEYIYQNNQDLKELSFLKSKLSSVGYSSSHMIIRNGKEDNQESRRVEFRIIVNSENRINKIITM